MSVPVSQYNSLCRSACYLQFMDSRAMGMAVNQRAYAKFLHDARDFFRRDINDVSGFHRCFFTTFLASLAGQRLTFAARHDVAQKK